jgi:UDPglucose--hexose-1-phosphate uridylyltransferase
MPQLRQNFITGEWVVFAPERAKRPSDYVSVSAPKKQKKENCPFCVDSKNSEFSNRVKEFDTGTTYLIPNKFPAFVEDPDSCVSKAYKIEDEFYKMKPSLGGHDVVVVKEHEQSLPTYTKEIWTDLLETFEKRYKHFGEICNVEYVMPIYNHGPEAAASIEHPHAQIFASAIVPNIVARELTHTAGYREDHKSCAFCDLVEHEQKQNTRVIFENEHFIAFTFYAARFPFETWIMPKKHQSHYTDITPDQIASLADICQKLFGRLNEVLNDPALNFFIHSAPVDGEKDLPYYHWHMEVAPRLAMYGGFEMGSGVIIDIIAPEQAADYIRTGKR